MHIYVRATFPAAAIHIQSLSHRPVIHASIFYHTWRRGRVLVLTQTLTLAPSPDRSGVWLRLTQVYPALQMTCCVHIGVHRRHLDYLDYLDHLDFMYRDKPVLTGGDARPGPPPSLTYTHTYIHTTGSTLPNSSFIPTTNHFRGC